MNGVGYNTALNVEDPWQFIGASFESVGDAGFIKLSELSSPEGIADGHQIQMSFTDDNGRTQMKVYEFWAGDGWADPDSGDILEADFAVQTAGKGFWFITGDPENVSFSEVSPLAE